MKRTPRDDYYVIMWNFVEPLFSEGAAKADRAIARFRELGCNGATVIATFVDVEDYKQSIKVLGYPPITFRTIEAEQFRYRENNFPFYVMNLCRPLYWKWEQAKPVFRTQYESFVRDRDRHVFVRKPCVNDPAVMTEMIRRTTHVVERLEPLRDLCLLYDLRDEPSVTSFLLASDSCFCPHCLAHMRDWLREQYGDLAALNAEWGTQFVAWEEVEPITTMEAIERRESGNWNFAPWHDHRAFMNATFARVCAELRDKVKEHDPDGLVGLCGTQCPSVFGGYDMAQLIPELDWAEPYTFGNSVDCFRSFKSRRNTPLLKTTGLGGGPIATRVLLWNYVFQSGGYSGTIIWQSNAMLQVNSPSLRPAPGASNLGDVFFELRSGVPKLLQQTEEISSAVAVHYSHASINADFITSVPPRWRSVAAYEPKRYPSYACRDAWWKLLEDRGLRPFFLSTAQIESGELQRRNVRLLVLPRSIALSDKEAAEIRRFVEAGGTLVADSFVGRMDEHCREREKGVLDDLFGIRRLAVDRYHASTQRCSLDYGAKGDKRPAWGQGPHRAECALIEEGIEPLDEARVLGCSEYTDSPIGIMREYGRGRTLLFNCAPLAYLEARRIPAGARNYQKFFGTIVELAGVKPEVQIRLINATDKALPGWLVFPFRQGKIRYFGLVPDLNVTQDILGGIEAAGEEEKKEFEVELRLNARGHVYEAITGKYLGQGSAVPDRLSAGAVRLYAVLPYRVRRLRLRKLNGGVSAALETSGKAGEHVLRFDLIDKTGKQILDSGANCLAPGGKAEWKPQGPIVKGVKVLCRDVATGVSAVGRL